MARLMSHVAMLLTLAAFQSLGGRKDPWNTTRRVPPVLMLPCEKGKHGLDKDLLAKLVPHVNQEGNQAVKLILCGAQIQIPAGLLQKASLF
jgi:hypothetical protein